MVSLRTAVTAFKRAPLLSMLSVTTIAFSLFAFGLFGLVALNIRNALERVEERVEIRAFIADGTFQFRPPLQEDRDTAFDGSRSIHLTVCWRRMSAA